MTALAAAPNIVYNSTLMEGNSAMTLADHRRSDDAEPDPGDTARALARMVERLSPEWSRPERFHERKSELIAECRRLARQLDREAAR